MSDPKVQGPTYRLFVCRWWDEPWFRGWPATTKLAFIELVTGRHTTSLPGLWRYAIPVAADQIGISLNTARKALIEIEHAGVAELDQKTKVVRVPIVLEVAPPANPNVVRGWKRLLADLPDCEVKRRAVSEFERHCATRGPEFQSALRFALGMVPETVSQTVDVTVSGTVGGIRSQSQNSSQKPEPDPETGSGAGAVAGAPVRAAGSAPAAPPGKAAASSKDGEESQRSDAEIISQALDAWPRRHEMTNRRSIEAKLVSATYRELCSPVDEAIAGALKQLDAQKKSPAVLPMVFGDWLDPDRLEGLQRQYDPEGARARRAQHEVAKTRSLLAQQEQRQLEERARIEASKREEDARFEREKHPGESRRHYDARRRVEDLASHENGADARSFVHEALTYARERLRAIEAEEARSSTDAVPETGTEASDG